MLRTLLARGFRACLAIWFALVATQGASLFACPTHSGAAVPAATAAVAHGMHGADAATSSGTHHSQSHQCACMGECCSAAPAAFVTVRYVLADVATVDVQVSAVVAVESPPSGRLPHAQPFANGPPVPPLA